jgi:bifunctional DNase/RNase
MGEVLMELSRILITELGDQQVIFLREKGGERNFPILIGLPEALAIDRRLKNKPTPRPMTHDLLATVIQKMGGRLERIVIHDLRDHTFFATLFIRRGEELLQVDARPSDAIALGVAFDTPLYVAEHVLNDVLKSDQVTQEDRLALLRQRAQILSERIGEMTTKLADADFLEQAPPRIIEEYRRRLAEMGAEHEAILQVLKKYG